MRTIQPRLQNVALPRFFVMSLFCVATLFVGNELDVCIRPVSSQMDLIRNCWITRNSHCGAKTWKRSPAAWTSRRAEDQPFSAFVHWADYSNVRVTRFGGTFSRIRRSRTAISRGPDDDFCLMFHRGEGTLVVDQVGRETALSSDSRISRHERTSGRFAIGCGFLVDDADRQ